MPELPEQCPCEVCEPDCPFDPGDGGEICGDCEAGYHESVKPETRENP